MKHPAAIAALAALLGTGGCFEWGSPTQPPMVQRQADAAAIREAADAPSVRSVVKTLKDDHGEPKQETQTSAATPDQQTSTAPAIHYSSGGGGGSSGGGVSANTVTISDVQFAGQSVMGANAPAALTGDVAGDAVNLSILGSGFVYPEDFHDIARRYLISLDPAFIAQTVIGNPKYQVRLDDTIALQPQDSGTFSAGRLDMTLARKGIVDLMLAGEHTVSVTVGFQKATAKVKFAAPASHTSLAPKITSAKFVKAVSDDGTEDAEWLVEVQGGANANFPLDFRKVYVKLNDQRTYWHATYVGASSSTGYVHVQDGTKRGPGQNSLTVITPFGIALANL